MAIGPRGELLASVSQFQEDLLVYDEEADSNSIAPVMEKTEEIYKALVLGTRDYVKKVLSNTANYAALISGQPQSLKQRLGLVGPRDASAPEPAQDLP